MADPWTQLEASLAGTLAGLRPDQFVIVEFDAGLSSLRPYAQAAREFEGYYCEVVSEDYLPRHEWPILVTHLERDGWDSPSAPDENWSCSLDEDPFVAARVLLGGLRDGRVCRDPSLYSWQVGTFPPGPDGGEPVPLPWIVPQARVA